MTSDQQNEEYRKNQQIANRQAEQADYEESKLRYF